MLQHPDGVHLAPDVADPLEEGAEETINSGV